MRGIVIEGVHATDTILTSSITGLPGLPVEDIRLSDIRVVTTMPGKPEWVSHPVPEVPGAYPQSRMFGWLPASGIYVRHVRGLSMRNMSFSAPVDEWRPTLIFDDVQDLQCHGLHSTPAGNGECLLSLIDVSNAWLSGATAPKGSRALLHSPSSKDVLISGCDLRGGAVAAEGDGHGVQAENNSTN